MRIYGTLPLFASALLALVSWQGSAQVKYPAQRQADRVSVSAGLGARVTLPGHMAPAWARASNDLGSVPDANRVQLNFALSRAPEVQAAFDRLLIDQQNPGSPRYHQWLTPAQVGEQFGPTQHDVDALTAWLTGAGFSVDGVTPSRTFVQVSAPAAVVSAALGTTLHRYSVMTAAGAEMRQAPVNEPSLPAALAPVVSYIGGLVSMPEHMHSHVTTHTAPGVPAGGMASGSGTASGSSTLRPDLTAGTTTYYLSPEDFNKIYDVPSAVTGAGQKVAILGGSRLDPNDLLNFEKLTALAAYAPNYIVGSGFGDPGVTNNGNQDEGTLDFERVYGTAPGVSVDQIIAKNWLDGTVNQNLVLYAINTVNDPVLSLSFGACEVDEPAGYVKTEDSMYSQAAAQGISVLVSSGDSGVAGCESSFGPPPASQFASISDICATSYVTCVGGTEFNDASNYAAYWAAKNVNPGLFSALGYIPEGAWNEPAATTTSASGVTTTTIVVAASGGGPSTIIMKPSFQTGTGVPADGFRDTPDISFSAASHDGYFSCLGYAGGSCVPDAQGFISFDVFSGTSASAPSMAGVAAMADQTLGARQGNLNPMLYRLAASTPGAFHDATIASSGVSGCTTATPSICNNSNASPGAQTGGIAGYLLQTGYDLVTGLGSLDVNAFLTAAAVPTLPGTASNLTAQPATITTAQTVVLTDIVSTSATTGAPTGTVTFTTNSGLNLGTVALVANTTANSETAATAALSFPVAGTYIVTAAYSGSTAFSASSATVTLVVSVPPLPATTTVLTGTTGTITALTPTSYTATVAPTAANTLAPAGNVQFYRTSSTATTQLGAAIPLAGGKATLTGVTIPTGAYTVDAVYLGDTNFAGSTSNGLSVTSTSVTTATTLSGVPATATSTTAFTASATVASSTGTGTPTGTVQFAVDGAAFGPGVALPATGTAATTLTLGAGTHSVCASYSGDATFASSTTAPCKTVTVTATPIMAALTATTTTPFSYQTDLLTVTYTGTAGSAAAPSATTFTDVFTPAGGAAMPANVLGTASSGTSGSASLSVGPLGVGTHKITASYPGDAVYGAATSNAITLTVAAATITLVPASTALSTPAGTSAGDAITLTDANYAGNENLACTVVFNGTGGATNAPVCTISPASLTLAGSGTSTVNISLSSVKSSAVTGGEFASRRVAGLGGAAVCGLLAFCFAGRRRLRSLRTARLFASMLLLAGTLFALAGCGGSNNFTGNRAAGTTAGSYTVTVTAASTYVSGSTTVSLTIQ